MGIHRLHHSVQDTHTIRTRDEDVLYRVPLNRCCDDDTTHLTFLFNLFVLWAPIFVDLHHDTHCGFPFIRFLSQYTAKKLLEEKNMTGIPTLTLTRARVENKIVIDSQR